MTQGNVVIVKIIYKHTHKEMNIGSVKHKHASKEMKE